MKYYHNAVCPIEIVKTENLNISFQRHNHAEHYVISIVAAGKAEVSYEKGHAGTYEPGDVFCVMPMQPHAVCVGQDAVMISICIGACLFREWTYDMIAHTVEEMTARTGIPDVARMRYVEILRKLSDAAGQRRSTTDPMLERVINTLTMFPERALSLERMAEELHMSKYYFIRKFRENVGLPPHQFHLQRRIRKAQKRLRAKCSIVDVALEMGFYDQSHFDHCFKRIVGISPKAYIAAIFYKPGADGSLIMVL